MDLISKLVISEVHEAILGVGIEYTYKKVIDREQIFAAPIPLTVAAKLAKSVLGPSKHTVRGFSPDGTLLNEWLWNQTEALEIQSAQTTGQKLSPKTAKKVQERSAKAPKVQEKVQVTVTQKDGMTISLVFDTRNEAKKNTKDMLLSDQIYSHAVIGSKHARIMRRSDKLAELRAPSMDPIVRRKGPICHKKTTPFGTRGYGWVGRAKDTVAKFSKG